MESLKYAIYALVLLLTVSCESVAILAENAGEILNGTAFAEKMLKTYKTAGKTLTFRLVSTKNGGNKSIFTIESIPSLKFYGTVPDVTGAFFITSIHFTFTSVEGWLEIDMETAGNGKFVDNGAAGMNFSVDGTIETGEITRGGIKRRGKMLSGSRAITELRNRRERITAVTSWMKEQAVEKKIVSQEEFENYWQPVILPETVKKKLRPPLFNELKNNHAKEKNLYVYSEDTWWNTAYTRAIFPEHLWMLRDSGSLLRDWEEASAWFFIDYNWENIVESLNETHYFIKD
jgi:hypothetical protein